MVGFDTDSDWIIKLQVGLFQGGKANWNQTDAPYNNSYL